MNATHPTPWAAWLAQQLAIKGWTQAELSRRSGVREDGKMRPLIPRDVISRWMNGQTQRPSYDVLPVISMMFNKHIDVVRQAAGYPLGTAKPIEPARPVGLGLDDAAVDLTPEQIESVRAVIRAMKPPSP